MNKKMLVSLVVGAATGVCFFTGGNDAYASETDGVWTPRTVDQIKADINQAQNNKYIIVWGDTLSGISEATNLTIQKLADMNKIANVDLIYAGNTLVFEGNVVSVENDKGETLVQSVIQDTPADKIDPSKPVGQPATNDNGAGNTNGNEGGNTGGNEGGNTAVMKVETQAVTKVETQAVTKAETQAVMKVETQVVKHRVNSLYGIRLQMIQAKILN